VIPYADFPYFAILLYALAAALVLGLTGRLRVGALLAVSAAMVLLQYSDPLAAAGTAAQHLEQLAFLAGYAVWSVLLIRGFAALRRRAGAGRGRTRAYYAAVALALLPLAAVKVYPLAVRSGWVTVAVSAAPRVLPVPHFAAAAGVAGRGSHVSSTSSGGPALAGTTSASRSRGAVRGGSPGSSPLRPRGRPAPAVPAAPPLAIPGLFDLFGFLGISYMAFRAVDTIIVLQDGLVADAPPLGVLAGYLLFFPTISAGPIDRYRRFAQGFLYKFILADLIFRYWLVPAAAGRSPGLMLSYMYAYSLYLFFDFAGYTAFAIGVSRFFGIRPPENFAGPFLSRNFREVWNRWFISLSWWLRDHVYMRFVLAATRRRWFRGNRHLASYAGFLITMGLMGVWHGLYLHYIVYGLYQGGMLIAYDLLGRWNRKRRLVPDNRWTRGASVAVTANLFCFGLLIFSGHLFG
jgi:membrane protein involved in D-alanine export